MKNLLLLATALILTINIYGAPRTESSALSIATKFLNSQASLKSKSKSNVTPQLIHSIEKDGETAVYVYGNNIAEGFVLVSGEDTVTPILGYSDNGNFDYESLPENAKWWINNYADEIQAIKKGVAKATSTIKSDRSVAPILGETLWGQDTPYNALTPSYDGKKCPTGCVATAMAQVMYYHKWPVTGTGSNTYISESYKFELSVDFSKSTYLWDNMTPTYNTQSNTESKDAVAKLMFDCGVATNMDYSPSGSGAEDKKIGKALVQNFNYDKGIRLLHKSFYSTEEWNDIMKSELDASRPVVYGGVSGLEAHEFVCDGYNTDGLFHINWGWNGMSNGYFLLSLLNPGDQGTGGGAPGAGFNNMQHIVVGIQKPTASPTEIPYFLVLGNENGCKALNNTDINITNLIFNHGYDLFSGTIFAEIVDVQSRESVFTKELITTEIEAKYKDAKNISENITLPATLRGTYELNYYSIDKNKNKLDIRTNFAKPILVISDQGIVIKDKNSKLAVSNVKITLARSSSFELSYNYSFDVTNKTDSDISKENQTYSKIKIVATQESKLFSYFDYYNIKKGETITVYSKSPIYASIGEELSISFEDYFQNDIYGDILKIDVPQYLIFVLENATVKNAEFVDPKTFQLDATIKNISEDDSYDGIVYAKIIKTSDNAEMKVLTANTKADMNQSVNVSFVGNVDLSPGNYYASIYYDLNNKSTAVWAIDVENKIPFTINPSGVEDAKTDSAIKIYPNPANDYIKIDTNDEPKYVKIFNAQGALLIEKNGADAKTIDISNLTPGVYIVHINCLDKIVSEKLIKQ